MALICVLGLVEAHGALETHSHDHTKNFAARNLLTAAGRITPLGNFTGFQDSIEYFFGLAPVPQATGEGIFEADVVAFSSECPEVASSVVYLKVGKVNNVTGGLLPGAEAGVSILKQVAFWRFDASGAVLNYEAWIPTLELWNQVSTGVSNEDPAVQHAQITQALCPAIQQNCIGADQQYSDIDDCISQLSNKTFGTFDEVWGDNIVCRQIHVVLTTIRPDIHCPHGGPTGGNKCVDIDYRVDYFDDEQLFGIANPFLCSTY
ncbi:hypothetical protein VP1G_05766 [Cytospora mali]|uniref:Uncharacterized protein n=1 Tax=Cytospora mali TaxID=578113 RepID=A0A194V3C8_CYTMA|nr:hypothetical protein VP1G_05766 [Valsa mali var. pyri (nom. inval.)]